MTGLTPNGCVTYRRTPKKSLLWPAKDDGWLPDYALDRHTGRGIKEKKRGNKHFIEEGAKLIQPDASKFADNEKNIHDKFVSLFTRHWFKKPKKFEKPKWYNKPLN